MKAAGKKAAGNKIVAENRKARYEYFINEQFEAGLVLQGWEVKVAKAAEVSLAESFIHLTDQQEVYLKNAYFAPYKQGDQREMDTRRNRKLLLHQHEIMKIAKNCLIKGNTCVPLKIYVDEHGRLKITIALATGKHAYDKKETIKQRDLQRELAKNF